jgi:hypothetical protein
MALMEITMETEKHEKSQAKNVPPYLPYKTFINFVDGLKVAMPARIDKSIMGSMAGGVQSQLVGALKYLKLIGQNDVPSDRLVRLANSEGPEREKVLREVLTSSYIFLFKDGIDLQRATPKLVDEHFENAGVSGDTVRKCVAFFLAAAKATAIPLSHHLANVKRGPRPGGQRTRRTSTGGQSVKGSDPSAYSGKPDQMNWSKLLLAKFPSFDPAWSPEVQTKWFDMFEQLMVSGPKEEEQEEITEEEAE